MNIEFDDGLSPWWLPRERRRGPAFVLSVLLVLAATILQYVLWPWINPAPYILYYPAVIVGALMGDGWTALGLSTVVAQYYFNPPYDSFEIPWPGGYVRLLVFFLSGVLIIALAKLTKRLLRRAHVLTQGLHASERTLSEVNAQLAEANRKLAADAAELERSNSELTRFAGIAAHDLKAPINTVSQFLMLLEEDYAEPLDNDAKGYISIMQQASERMRKLIDRLLSYSRIGAKRDPFRRLELASIVGLALDNLRAELTRTKAVVDLAPLPVVDGDEFELMQLFQNLIGNALKYSRPETIPRVDISAHDQGDEWRIDIADNGAGIADADLAMIFEPFRRSTEPTDQEGAGLGLAIVEKTVVHHGGRVSVTSKLGVGSTFSFTLPKTRD